MSVALACVASMSFALCVATAQPVERRTPETEKSPWTVDASGPLRPYHDAWPARWRRDGMDGLGIILPLETTPARMSMVRLFVKGKPSKADLAVRAALVGDADAANFEFEGMGAVLFIRSNAQRRAPMLNEGPSLAAGPDTGEVFVFVSARGAGNKQSIDRTYFAYYPPAAPRKSEAAPPLRAVALLMPGLLGMPETTIDPLTRTLRTNGIGVLRMLCQPARFTEHAAFSVARDQMDATAADIAQYFDEATAECAYAAQAAWGYVDKKYPETNGLPRLAIGLSGGAMTLPTVVAREPGEYNAAILIGGGCDFWLINERSNYRANVDSVRCQWSGEKPTEEELKQFDRLYLERTRLDSFHTAPALKHVKTLMIHGELDRAVPAELGDLLWQRLGKPERWSYAATHETLCGFLPTEFAKLNAWIETALFGAPGNTPIPEAPR